MRLLPETENQSEREVYSDRIDSLLNPIRELCQLSALLQTCNFKKYFFDITFWNLINNNNTSFAIFLQIKLRCVLLYFKLSILYCSLLNMNKGQHGVQNINVKDITVKLINKTERWNDHNTTTNNLLMVYIIGLWFIVYHILFHIF